MEQATKPAFNLDAVFNKRPLIISGPCSAETEEQLIQTANRLAATGKIDMLRDRKSVV
jgi:chorismate mutase